MRVAHLGTDEPIMCSEQHVTFAAAVEEIATWLDNHEGEFIRIYINVSFWNIQKENFIHIQIFQWQLLTIKHSKYNNG